MVYKVIDHETGEAIGHISLDKIDRNNKSARVGKVLVGDKNTRGKGIGQQMIKEILKIAFDELQLHRVSLGYLTLILLLSSVTKKQDLKKRGCFEIQEKTAMNTGGYGR